MEVFDLFEEIYFALSANKVRSFLTILGIVIGIGSVIAMVSIGQGAQGNIESSIESIGSNLLMVMPGMQRGPGTQVSSGRGSATSLTMDDVEAIADISTVKEVAPSTSGRYQVTAKGTNTNVSVIGTNNAYANVRKVEIDLGNFITDQNNESVQKVAVIGSTVRDDLFGEDSDPVGEIIKINKIEFKIVGVTKSKGGSSMDSSDNTVYVPLASAQRYLSNSKYISTISVEAVDQQSMTLAKEDITSLLLTRHKITDSASADFSVMSQTDIADTASSVTGTFTILLACIAGISLLVGGIGIMNMMLTTVTERTREIGLRKAIGAQRKDINMQFLMEAITLTFLGGVIGVLAGWLVAYVATKFFSVSTAVTWSSVFLAFGVSAFIGVAFGYYPANRASKLNPIDALRYE